MTSTEIKQLAFAAQVFGHNAKKSGIMRSPAMDKEFNEWNFARNAPIGHPANIPVLDAWLRGWDLENLAA
jgi:hypothetical protein